MESTSPPTAYFHTRTYGLLAGVASAGLGLSFGELLAQSFKGMLSPIIGVGNRAIDFTPVPVKNFAIQTFGTHDKQALLIGMGASIAIFACIVGILARTRRWIGVVGLLCFGALGVAAATTGRSGSWRAAIPAGAASIVAIGALLVLLRTRPSSHAEANLLGSTDSADALSRRRFISLGAVATAAVAFGGAAKIVQANTAKAVRNAIRVLPKPFKRLLPIPAAAEITELKTATPFITPNKDFYRIDTALVIPQIDINTWKLNITGMVKNKLSFSYDDLLSRNLIEQDITLTCVSNEVGGILMGNARWLGIPLQELLDEAGVEADASQILGRSTDGWSAGFPLSALQKSQAIVAVGMNGEPLPFAHGYPARLVVPGIYGYASATKWLDTIELTTLAKAEGYWVPRGYSKEAPIKMASRIDVPRGLSTIPAGRTAIAGVAWSQTVGISRVEVSIDKGPWQQAELSEQVSIDTWRQWRLVWDALTGQHDIAVRCFDAKGQEQIEERVAPLPNGATGFHSVVVFVS
jgi:DMSO/TMAO reductase YedYZ molybdopterin-dependent catalytic subunit